MRRRRPPPIPLSLRLGRSAVLIGRSGGVEADGTITFHRQSEIRPDVQDQISRRQVAPWDPGPVSIENRLDKATVVAGGGADELSPNFGDGRRVQAAAVWDREDAGLR